MKDYLELSNRIIKELKEKGYRRASIDYKKFKEIYRPYEKEISELDFALIIGIKETQHSSMKYKKYRTIIIDEDIEKERKQEILQELTKKGYENKKISYEEFVQLYTEYKQEMTEVEFADILKVTKDNLNMSKKKQKRITIMKSLKAQEERKEEIVAELKQQGYENKKITYEEFRKIYKKYEEEMTETDFASLLGVRENFYNVKSGKYKTATIKFQTIPQERRREILEALKKEGYRKASIDYNEFKQIYRQYRQEMTEKEFANVIGIKTSSFDVFKSAGTKLIIIKEELAEERKEEIFEELKQKGYGNKGIDYKEFKEIYRQYEKELSEKELANIVGIKQFSPFKHGRIKRAIIIKYAPLTEERRQEIIEELKQKGYEGRHIKYEEFEDIYELYKSEIQEREFARLLGIRKGNFNDLKNNGTRAIINFQKREENLVKQHTTECREYTKQELEEMAVNSGISLEEIISIVANTDLPEVTQSYIDAIETKDSVFIGKTKMEQTFIDENAEELFEYSIMLSKKVCKKFHLQSCQEDFASDALLYIMEQRGDIGINFDREEALEIIKKTMYNFLKYRCMNTLKVKYVDSIDKEIEGQKNGRYVRQKLLKDKTQNTENEAIESYNSNEIKNADSKSWIQRMNELHREGMPMQHVIEYVAEELEIPKEELLEKIREYLLKERLVKKTEDNKYLLGEWMI